MPEKKTVELSIKTWGIILDAADSYQDKGSENEGWQSRELKNAVEDLRTQLEN